LDDAKVKEGQQERHEDAANSAEDLGEPRADEGVGDGDEDIGCDVRWPPSGLEDQSGGGHGRRGQSAHAQAGAEQCVRLQADEGDAVIAVAAVEKDEQSNQGCERGDGEGSHGGGVNIGHRERSHDSTAMFFEVEDDGLVGRDDFGAEDEHDRHEGEKRPLGRVAAGVAPGESRERGHDEEPAVSRFSTLASGSHFYERLHVPTVR